MRNNPGKLWEHKNQTPPPNKTYLGTWWVYVTNDFIVGIEIEFIIRYT